MMAAFLLPLCVSDLDSDWRSRVECSDAAPGGHGRAWACFPESSVHDIARLSECKVPYTSLQKEFGIDLDAHYKCPIARVGLSEPKRWRTAPRPDGFEHIPLEEADAMCWSMEARLRRPDETGCRLFHGGYNVANVAAFMEGRSVSRRLIRRCRRAAAIQLGGRIMGFSGSRLTGTSPMLRLEFTQLRRRTVGRNRGSRRRVRLLCRPSPPGGD